MGIPYYFTHLIQKHRDVVVQQSSVGRVDNLYFDCNSIIYDELRKAPLVSADGDQSGELIRRIIRKIWEYVETVRPVAKVLVAFDGVAPVAKLSQQRNRRYKSAFESELYSSCAPKEKESPKRRGEMDVGVGVEADAAADSLGSGHFTPGTAFMERLARAIRDEFERPSPSPSLFLHPEPPSPSLFLHPEPPPKRTKSRAKSRVKGKAKAEAEAEAEAEGVEFHVSTSDVPGEGEHKIFEFIRANPEHHRRTVTFVYGIDSDLVMLALNHSHASNYMLYLYRETPEFIKSIDQTLDPNAHYVIDIPRLCEHIVALLDHASFFTQLACPALRDAFRRNQLYDYILLCFLLGNDFVPKSPAVNIRAQGIDFLVSCYRTHLDEAAAKNASASAGGRCCKEADLPNLTDGRSIFWPNVRRIVHEISTYEHARILQVHHRRGQPYAFRAHEDTAQSRFASVPMVKRSAECAINPTRVHWQSRFYDELFDFDDKREHGEKGEEEKGAESAEGAESAARRAKHVRAACRNYLEALEWTMLYYTSGCVDWRWRYVHHYAPLFQDVVRHVPCFRTSLVAGPSTSSKSAANASHAAAAAVDPLVLLAYVTPAHNMRALLPAVLADRLLEQHPEWYRKDWAFRWAYCRYFWEAHAVMRDIDLAVLEGYVREYRAQREITECVEI